MVDFLASVDSDKGPQEPIPVTLVSSGLEIAVTNAAQIGATNETAAASDTAASGLNGRLQRIAQRLTSLIALFPASLGAKASSASLSVTPATDARYPIAPLQASGTDRSTAASTTSVPLMVANPSRTAFYIKNDTTIDVWFNVGATAVATAGGGNMKVAANGGYYESAPGFVTTAAINIIAASGTPAITAREF